MAPLVKPFTVWQSHAAQLSAIPRRLIRDGSKLNESPALGLELIPVIDEIRSSIPEDKPDWTEKLVLDDARSSFRDQPLRTPWGACSRTGQSGRVFL